MPYVTQADLLQRMTLKQLTELTDDGGTGQPDASIVVGVLEEASGKVDGYTRNRYVTPLQQSDEVTAIARDIAVYLLFSRRPQKMQETIRQRYDDAMALLKDVSTNEASLDQPTGATPQTASVGPVFPRTNDLRFTERNMKGFI